MSERNKSLLIILSTLLIGMLIGALVWGGVSRQRNDRLANLRQTDGMVNFIVDGLEPLEEEQRNNIMEIVRAHGDEMVAMRREMRDLQSSLRTDLDEVLNEEQKKVLNRFIRSRINRQIRGERPPRGDRMNRGTRSQGDSLGRDRPERRERMKRPRRAERDSLGERRDRQRNHRPPPPDFP